jgi:hypothetical protein
MNHNEAENYLAHFGKKGMKWGQRSRKDAGVGTAVGNIASAGLYLGNKSRYKTPEAKRLRNSAGKARLATLGFMGAGMATVAIGAITGSAALASGSSFVARAFNVGANVSAITANVQGVRAVQANKKG